MTDTSGAPDAPARTHSNEKLGIAGAGTIATGLAATASTQFDVLLWARSVQSAERAEAAVAKACSKLEEEGADPSRVRIVTDLGELAAATYLVEAIAEDHAHKVALLAELGDLDVSHVIATTTSSLSVSKLAEESGHPTRFVGLHVFNPVTRMELVEVIFPEGLDPSARTRTLAMCEALGKTAVEVPDTPGFVVNRLLFPYLFDAVGFMAETGLTPEAVDQCMTLGAGMPMGPLALLDFVGLDVAQAIGDSIGVETPATITQLISEGALGRKSGRGFYNYS